jgi:isopenicillin-N N-acyltransferase like protein
VLDYMSEIYLQDAALVTVYMPEGKHKWMSLGYAGFIGTVTAMNERGLAIGEMGGRGEGQWDGLPMSLLLRDVMERAANVDEALAILRAAPRTCEYYYVLSDRSGTLRAVHCTPAEIAVLEPGQQHPRLPLVPGDVVLVSGEDRAKLLSQRIQADYGRIDVPRLIEIIKRPVAMTSNLHDAIFAPETLEMWFADAGPRRPACDQPYARVNLQELLQFYAEHVEGDRR